MKSIKETINQQLATNSHVNLYREEAIDAFLSVDQLWNNSFTEYSLEEKENLINFTAEKALKAFFCVNQYYHFNNDAIEDLKNIYRTIFDLKEQNKKVSQKIHALNIQNWLKNYQSAYQSYFEKQTTLLSNSVPCFEYSAELQLELLHINIHHLQQPILDIGCGEKANLVHYLKTLNIDVVGIDRLCSNSEITLNADWLEFDFQPDTWGTIISHLGFTNHFHHQHLQQNGDAETYARKYMEILGALKIGGCFYYTPGLAFIEQYLPNEKFLLTKKVTSVPNYYSTKIVRIK